MGKFDGILICTDLDDTLLTRDKRVSDENKEAIAYFKKNGGLFTFATGRVPLGARPILQYVQPNAPMVCFNGSVIYDYSREQMIWSSALDKSAGDVVQFVIDNFPTVGVEVCTAGEVFFCKVTDITERHKKIESFPDNYVNYRDVKDDWNKVIFMVTIEEMPSLRQLIDNSEYAEKYSFVKSSPWYYELLPKGMNKGSGIIQLAKLLGIGHNKLIAVGDNENDIQMIKNAGVGIAVNNAVDEVKRAADYITVGNEEHAIAAVIRDIENGKLKI